MDENLWWKVESTGSEIWLPSSFNLNQDDPIRVTMLLKHQKCGT